MQRGFYGNTGSWNIEMFYYTNLLLLKEEVSIRAEKQQVLYNLSFRIFKDMRMKINLWIDISFP